MLHSPPSPPRRQSDLPPALRRVVVATLAAFAPPPTLTVSQWADRERYLSPEASAEPGHWDTARAEYLRGVMDAISDPAVTRVVVAKGSQVGYTECLGNIIGFHIDQDPAPILVVQPTVEMAEAWSKDRLAPMVRDTPCLAGKVQSPLTRDSGNTLRQKVFTGGRLAIVGANSPAGLASRPVRIVVADEVDRFPVSAGSEGDPLALASKLESQDAGWQHADAEGNQRDLARVAAIRHAALSGAVPRLRPCASAGVVQCALGQDTRRQAPAGDGALCLRILRRDLDRSRSPRRRCQRAVRAQQAGHDWRRRLPYHRPAVAMGSVGRYRTGVSHVEE